VAVTGYVNELALAVVVAHGVTVCWARLPRRTVGHWLVASVVGALPVVPLIVLSLGQTGQVGWLIVPDAASVPSLLHLYFGTSVLVAAPLLGLAVVGGLAWRRSEETDRAGNVSLPAVAVPLLAAPAIVIALASVLLRPLFDPRYVFYAESGAALLAAAGAAAVGRRLHRGWMRWTAAAALCVAVFAAQLGAQLRERAPISRGGYSEVAAFVAAHARSGDGLLFVQNYFRKIRLAYPYRFRKVTDVPIAVTPTQAGDFRGTDLPIGKSAPLLLAHRRMWTVGYWTPDGKVPDGEDGPAVMAYRLVRAEYRPVSSARFGDLAVRLWVRRSSWPARA
jgi:mannosyltransferase